MELYTLMRQFADSWGLLYMMGIFIFVVLYVFRPGAKEYYDHAASIALEEEPKND